MTSPTPGAIFEDLLIVGTKVGETDGAAPGDIRAFDLRTGAMRWIFHTIPRDGEFGAETWPKGAWQTRGGANSWSGVTLDRERGLVFLPTGSATPDFWGGDRAGDNLFANSLLALDARTGERRWHFQFVHHDLWDRDLPAPPTLVTIERDGRKIDAVAQTTKAGYVYVFERESGEPVFEIEERPVPGALVDGQHVSKTQPFPVAPPPYTRQRFDLSWLDDRGEAFRKAQLERLAGVRMGENYIPPSLEGSIDVPGLRRRRGVGRGRLRSGDGAALRQRERAARRAAPDGAADGLQSARALSREMRRLPRPRPRRHRRRTLAARPRRARGTSSTSTR